MQTPPYLRPAVHACSALTAIAGASGMVASLLLLASECTPSPAVGSTTYVMAGAAGFVAGAVLAGSGLLALALLTSGSMLASTAPHLAPATPRPLALAHRNGNSS